MINSRFLTICYSWQECVKVYRRMSGMKRNEADWSGLKRTEAERSGMKWIEEEIIFERLYVLFDMRGRG